MSRRLFSSVVYRSCPPAGKSIFEALSLTENGSSIGGSNKKVSVRRMTYDEDDVEQGSEHAIRKSFCA